MKPIRITLMILAAPLILWACSQDQSSDKATINGRPNTTLSINQTVTIGTAGIASDSYAIGLSIARLVNARGDDHHIQCIPVATGGSIFNINALMSGDLQFGIVQSERQEQAVRGGAEWQRKGPQNNLRAVFNMPNSSLALLTSVQVPDAVVYAVAREVFKNLKDFKRLHPALSALTAASMCQGMSAPIHPGAVKYYKEAGLM